MCSLTLSVMVEGSGARLWSEGLRVEGGLMVQGLGFRIHAVLGLNPKPPKPETRNSHAPPVSFTAANFA